ncbi:MAG: DUF2497 domain-containing protein [Proteobacteria bacterium]|nr:DUF2497 domain-containing protein [Pseudomonadota bacterium]
MSGPHRDPRSDRPEAGGGPADPNADPSMEDILASIRRILSEDEAQNAPPAGQDDGVLQLDQAMMVPGSKPSPPPASAAPAAPSPAAAPSAAPPFAAAPPPPPPQAAMPAAAPPPAEPFPLPMQEKRAVEPTPAAPAAPASAEALVAPEAATAAAGLVGNLVRTLSAERTTRVNAGGPTIEDLVRQEIRPLLKEWLDTHLPPLVERLVRAEIERVVGRAVP